MIVAMLLSGQGLPDILRSLGGSAGAGSAGLDGLAYLRSSALHAARTAFPMVQNPATINIAAEKMLGALGMNPYTGFGQGATQFLSGLYHVFPDTLGTVMGVPNRGSFFNSIANGAYGINVAAGLGGNPFERNSVIDMHKRAMEWAQTVHRMGVNERTGGYDLNYSHGLNFSEMGVVAQRLMTSEIPYTDASGNRFGMSDEGAAKKFEGNMSKFGSEVNKLVSMVNKVTGSMDETMKLLDSLGGGNFLSSVDNMKSVENRANRLVHAIRVSAAMSGEPATKFYANMLGLQNNMMTGMGLNPYIANQSGMNSLFRDMAATGTIAYGMWAASHQGASPQEREMALLSANARAQSYMDANGSKLAAAVAANYGAFSDEQRNMVVRAFREGRPNDISRMVREVLGEGLYSMYMTDPAFQLMARKRAMEEHGDYLEELDRAGFEGNILQARSVGNRTAATFAVNSLDERLRRLTGRGGFSSMFRKASVDSLRDMARGGGFGDEAALGRMGERELRELLSEMGGVDTSQIDDRMFNAMLDRAHETVVGLAMSNEEQVSAREALKREIDASGWDESKKTELKNMVDSGREEKAMKLLSSGKLSGQVSAMRKRITGGKLFQSTADAEKTRLDLAKNAANIMLAGGNANMAAVMSAIGKIGQLDLTGKSPQEIQAELQQIYEADMAAADATQNRFTNLWAAGDGRYAENAVEETKSNLERLANSLREKGDESDIRELIETAYGSGSSDAERGRAEKELSERIGDEKNWKTNRALLKAAYGTKVGSGTGIDVLLGNQDASKDDILNIARGAAREGSTASDIGASLGKLAEGFAAFMNNPLSVLNKQGPIKVEPTRGINISF